MKIRNLFGICKGMLEYARNPSLQDDWEGAFNRQKGRQEIFLKLTSTFPFEQIVETGTYRGMTTQFMAEKTQLPIHTVEAGSSLYGYAKQRLKKYPQVHLYFSDSRSFLENWLKKNNFKSTPLFFYLDAHWAGDVPLRDEMDLIFSYAPRSVIMVDDFEVPSDPGYRYDHYGPDKSLTLAYLKLSRYPNARAFFPSLPSERETGAKRGCTLLSIDSEMIARLEKIDLLQFKQSV